MKTYLGNPLYSATDLLTFLGCRHSTALDREVLGGSAGFPDQGEDEYLGLLKKKGLEHEQAYLETLRAESASITEIARIDSIEEMAAQTRAAMMQGKDVIYQGALAVPGWHG